MTTVTDESALLAARNRYERANPTSRARYEEAVAVMPGGNTRSTLYYSPFPLTMRGGQGSRLEDVDGHEYLDLLGEYTAGLYGHSDPVIRQAIDAALDAGWNLGAHGPAEARLAALLCERFPSLELVRFVNSGTEANLLALATACARTGRREVLVFDGGYHGSVLSFRGGGIPINAPHEFVVGEYNAIESTRELLGRHGPRLAAILVEPMLGSGGCIPAEREFLQVLRHGADASGALLIFDEVMTSRMSEGGLQKLIGITPDLTTLGKYIGGGMTFGAFGGSADIMSMYDPRRPDAVPHAGTFNNNVLSMAAGYAGLTQVFTADAADALFERGERLRPRLNQVCAGAAMHWTGLGSLMTGHFQAESIRSAAGIRPDPVAQELFHLAMLEAGFYLARRGMIALSLAVTDEDCEAFCAAVERYLA